MQYVRQLFLDKFLYRFAAACNSFLGDLGQVSVIIFFFFFQGFVWLNLVVLWLLFCQPFREPVLENLVGFLILIFFNAFIVNNKYFSFGSNYWWP
jgi:hypothetical protein